MEEAEYSLLTEESEIATILKSVHFYWLQKRLSFNFDYCLIGQPF